ncbi:MAG: hypothetical protein CMM03_16280 [Rhodopirellula sp.]|nr:hypothetical protein [Rhodopirellula sp.]
MKKNLIISAVIIVAFLALVYSPSATPSFMVEFKTPGVKPIDLKSANLLDEVNAIELEGISAEENVVAGLYGVAYALESLEPNPEQVRSLEAALGAHVAVDPRTRLTFGKQWFWDEPYRQLSNEDPILRRYLQRHESTLDQLSPILERPVFANYYYSGENEQSLLNALLPLASTCREYGRVLKLRARVALAEGRIGDAIADAKQIHRLGRHFMHASGTVVEVYVGIAISGIATDVLLEILSNPATTLDDLSVISDAVNSAPPVSGIKPLDVLERLMVLQIAEGLERNGPASVARPLMVYKWEKADKTIVPTLGMTFTDWPEVYRAINRHFDEYSDVLLIADEAQRRAAIKALDSDSGTFNFHNDDSIEQSLANHSVWYLIDELFLSNTNQYMRRLELARQENEVLNLCIALKRFNLEHRRYPDSLDELIVEQSSWDLFLKHRSDGEYLDRIPVDFGTGLAVGYIPLEAGCVVYTSGRNEQDNRGWGYRNLSTSNGTYYDDVTYVIGKDDRPAPEGMKTPMSLISGRLIGYPDDWDEKRLSLAGEQISLSEFKTICNIEELMWLDLSLSDLPDNWHQALPRLQNLEVLSLVGIDLTEEILANIAKLPSLQTLILNGASINGNLGPIAGHPNLETLLLARSSVTDADLLVLETLPKLRNLNLSETQVSDDAGPILAELHELTQLQLSGTQITDRTLAHVSELTELEVLRVDFTEVTNAGVASLNNAKLHTLGLIGTEVNNEISGVLAGKTSLRSVFLYETDFDSEIQRTGPPVALIDRSSADMDQYEPSNLEHQQTNWGKLAGIRGCYEIVQDENPLRLRLTSRESEYGFTNDPTKAGTGVSILNPVKGDFDVSVKVVPNWELHDEIMVDEKIGTPGWKGGPYLGAGLLIQQSEGHYFKWSWNSIDARSLEVYSNITPEYFIYPKIRKGPLADFAFDFHEIEGSRNDELGFPTQYGAHSISSSVPSTFNSNNLMAYPDLAVQGPLKQFDHSSIWLRLRRQGNTVTAFSSEDGESWTLTSELNTHFNDEVQVGLWCGKLSKSDFEFHFEDFTIKQ